jgi:hypothetical protein
LLRYIQRRNVGEFSLTTFSHLLNISAQNRQPRSDASQIDPGTRHASNKEEKDESKAIQAPVLYVFYLGILKRCKLVRKHCRFGPIVGRWVAQLPPCAAIGGRQNAVKVERIASTTATAAVTNRSCIRPTLELKPRTSLVASKAAKTAIRIHVEFPQIVGFVSISFGTQFAVLDFNVVASNPELGTHRLYNITKLAQRNCVMLRNES